MPRSFNLKNRLVRYMLRIGSLGHIRHFRGHGIHSPYMYAMVRNVLMKRPRLQQATTLYTNLRRFQVGRRTATYIQNLHSYCKYTHTVILNNNEQIETILPHTTYIILSSAKLDDLQRILAPIGQSECILYVLAPRYSRARYRACQRIIHTADCVSVDKGSFMFFIFNRKLQKQHYKL